MGYTLLGVARVVRAGVRSVAVRASLVLIMAALVTACPNRELARPDPGVCAEQMDRVAAEANRDIDILFVIDNSGSMAEEQRSLAENFQRFIDVLENVEGGLPNLHIGVISTDMGTGDRRVPNCTATGDAGRLLAGPRVEGCSPPGGAFISDIARTDGTRVKNYDGDLADVFSCIAQLGTEGCNYEQPLRAAKRALDGSNPINEGFLRYNAFLLIVIISDEDDCSVFDNDIFSDPEAGNDSELGPLTSFRCFEFGVMCDPDDPRETGEKDGCVPRVDSPYMHDVFSFADYFKSLKLSPDKVMVAGILGDGAPVIVGNSDTGRPQLIPSCISGAGSAVPAIRTEAFMSAFPERATFTRICDDDLSAALTQIAEEVSKAIGDTCIYGDIDNDPDQEGIQAECLVSDMRFSGTDHQEEFMLHACAEVPPEEGDMPCWHIEENYTQCPDSPTGALLVVERGAVSVPLDTEVVVRCAAGCNINTD